jgi:energy-coupling factor transporter ATP-binding protein EcfA2
VKLTHLKITNCSRVADIDMEVRDNMVLIGPNGSGKTTVLKCLDMLLGMSDQQLRETLMGTDGGQPGETPSEAAGQRWNGTLPETGSRPQGGMLSEGFVRDESFPLVVEATLLAPSSEAAASPAGEGSGQGIRELTARLSVAVDAEDAAIARSFQDRMMPGEPIRVRRKTIG